MLVPRSPRRTPQVAEAETTAASDDHPQDEAEDEQEGTQAGREKQEGSEGSKKASLRARDERVPEARCTKPAARGRQGTGRPGQPRGGPLGAARQFARKR